MQEEARKLKNNYMREWRKRNKDKVKKYNQDYWNRKSEKVS